MLKGSGIDILAMARLRNVKNKVELVSNILTLKERRRATGFFRRDAFHAVLFTIKEAILKSLGCGLKHGSLWHQIELDEGMLPSISRSLIRLAAEGPIEKVHVSATCTKDYALSIALAEAEGSPPGGV